MPLKIDAHHHLWRYNTEEFGWIGTEMAALQRDFLPEDLVLELARAGLDGAVAVQARQSLEETRWLLGCAANTPAMLGVVGWVPLAAPNVGDVLAEFRGSALKGVRHVVQDEPDDNFILGADFNRGVAVLHPLGLTYDVLIHERHLPQATAFVRRHPQGSFILDHLAKPLIREQKLEPWRTNLRALAASGNVCCKLSGLMTEADWARCSLDDLRPYLDAALDAFGAERLMAGSDWPVCLVASSYERWWSMLREWAAPLSSDEQAALFGGTAQRVYGLA